MYSFINTGKKKLVIPFNNIDIMIFNVREYEVLIYFYFFSKAFSSLFYFLIFKYFYFKSFTSFIYIEKVTINFYMSYCELILNM